MTYRTNTPISIIIGTAGHIDHGKSSLVQALTGQDPDRLPDEKRRGITIDLGFADLDLGDVRVGFVDVPGHERFIKNMLAGVHGIDAVALVIAADEGVMPQTREHFDICRLLDVPRGLVVITKTDLVEEELLSLVLAEAEELVADTFLESAPIVCVSAHTATGLEEFRNALREIAAGVPERSSNFVTRLPIDRAFTMKGFGAVVTGTLVSGEISEADELELLPARGRVRVRGVQVHGNSVRRANSGQRTAVNLAGVDVVDLERGMVLAEPGRLRPTQIMNVQLSMLGGAPRPIRSRSRVRLHIGSAEALARVRVLNNSEEISAGETDFAQLRLEAPVVAWHQERFILRSYSPAETVAGGLVLDPLALKHRGRQLAKVMQSLRALRASDQASVVEAFVETAEETGLSLADLAARTGWNDDALMQATRNAEHGGAVVNAQGVLISKKVFEQLSVSTLAEVKRHHQREPLARGLAREILRERHFAHTPPEVFQEVMAWLEQQGVLASEKELVRASEHSVELSPADQRLRERIMTTFEQAGLEAPTLDQVFAAAGVSAKERTHARKILQLLIDNGALLRVQNEMFFPASSLNHLRELLRQYGSEHEPDRLIDVASFKELAGVSRKYAIPLLEYFDREHVTRRAGDKRLIL